MKEILNKIIFKTKEKWKNKITKKLFLIWFFSIPFTLFLVLVLLSFLNYLFTFSKISSLSELFNNIDIKLIGYAWLFWIILSSLFLYFIFLFKSKHLAPSSNRSLSIQYGSSQWLSEEQLNFEFPSVSYNAIHDKLHGFVIQTISENNKTMSNIKSETQAMVLGFTGSGKTQKIIIPTIQFNARTKVQPTMLITDPKGQLFETQSKLLKEQGYSIKIINLRDNNITSFWNPLNKAYNLYKSSFEFKEKNNNKYLKLQAKAIEELDDVATTLSPKTNDKNTFFETNATNLIKAIAIAMLEDLELDNSLLSLNLFNLTSISTILNKDNLIEYFKTNRKETSRSLITASGFINGKTTDASINIKQQAITALQAFNDPWIQTITCQNNIDFSELVTKPTAIFLIVPDEKVNRHSLANLFITQVYKALIEEAHKYPYGKLPRPVYFLCDEFANLPVLNNIDNWITTSRSRNVWFMLIIQDLAQLEAKYGKKRDTILGNCGLHIFLGSNEHKTCEYYSKLLGTQTLTKKTVTTNKNKITGTSATLEKANLLEASELLKLKPNQAIIKFSNLILQKLLSLLFIKFLVI